MPTDTELEPEFLDDPRDQPVPRHTAQKWSLAVMVAGGVVTVLIIIAVLVASSVQTPVQRIVRQLKVSAATVLPTDYVSIAPGIKPAPDGQLHDAWSQTTFYAKAGVPVKLVINNTDDVPHGFVVAGTAVALKIKPGSHTYTFMIPKAGKYMWACNEPCDPYSMAHMGYMMGNVVVE